MTVSRLPLAASLFGPRSGGRLATVQTNHNAIAIRIPARRSLRWRITSCANSGRMSTNADPAANTALTSSPTGIATLKPE